MSSPVFSLMFVHHALSAELRAFEQRALAAQASADLGAFAEPLAFFSELMHFHHQGEEAAVFPVLEAASPGLASTYLYDHAHEIKALAALHATATAAAAGTAVDLAEFQRSLCTLVAAGLAHIEKENTLVLPWLAEHFSAPEQGELVGKVIAAIPKDKMPDLVPWIVARLSLEDAASYVRGLAAGMPAPVFQAAKGWIQAGVSEATFAALRQQVPELG